MEDAVADEDLHVAAVASHRNINRDLLFGILQVGVHAFFEGQFLGSDFKTRLGGFVNVEFVLHGHWHPSLPEISANRGRSFRPVLPRQECPTAWAQYHGASLLAATACGHLHSKG